MTKQAIRRQAKANAHTASVLWEQNGTAGRDVVEDACTVSGVKYPASRYGLFPEMLRTQAPDWWGRQIKKADRREAETLELKHGRITRYCSDLMLDARRQQKKDNRDLLAQMVAVCETADGDTLERDLLELVKGSNANPAVRRAELMTRISGFEKYANGRKHVPYFLTLTCPSRFHRNSGDRWSGATPREANDYLCKVWAQARAALGRMGILPYGFRIAEPHKDACPHWHCLFWFESHHEARQAIAVIRRYFLADSPNEPGAQRQRVKVERINHKKGSATGYIAKYICKNVDGIYEDGEGQEYRFDDKRRDSNGDMQKTGMSSDEAAARVDAWAACWGIRQFQQIGGPKVGAWRELRRLGDDMQEGEIEPFRAAANAGQWDLFCALDDQHRATYGDRVRVWSDTSVDKLLALSEATEGGIQAASDEAVKACLSKWQEPTLRTLQGVAFGRGLKLKTRRLKWVLMLKKAEAAQAETRRQQEQAFRHGFLSRIEADRKEVAAEFSEFDFALGFSPGAAPPRWALESCQ